MGFMEDLVKTIQEAADEARAQQRQRKSSPEWSPVPKQTERQSARVVRRTREEAPASAPEPTAHPQRAAVDAPQQTRPDPHRAGTVRMRMLLHHHRTLRELMLLKEILDRPLALRSHRGWPR